MLKFPYGIADFQGIRRDGLVYVDRTQHIQTVESLGRVLVFLRPRRFGKSLHLRTLATYYDLRFADDFEEIFGGLAIANNPTPLRNQFFVLQWNFSRVTARGGVDAIAKSLLAHIRSRAEVFSSTYRDHLEHPIDPQGDAATVMDRILAAVQRTPYKLYLLIDEYDNFVNEVMVRDIATYKALFEADGPYKELMKVVKDSTEGAGLERVFVTGVSPVALNDLTSGFNMAQDVSLSPELATLCGFREKEIRALLEQIAVDRDLPADSVDQSLETMRIWYNGYRFTDHDGPHVPEAATEGVYNPINVLHFLQHLNNYRIPPDSLQDENLRTDQAKLSFVAETGVGAGVIEDLTEGKGIIEIPRLVSKFSIANLTLRLSKDPGAVASFLYYIGLLTLTDTRGQLRIPNLVVRKLYLERLLEIFLPDFEDSYQAQKTVMRFFRDGDLKPLLSFFEDKLLPILSNRDRGTPPKLPGQSGSGVNETTLKALFLSVLFDDIRYVVRSEHEVERGYVDLCLLTRPETRDPGAFDLLFEFKLVRRQTLGRKGHEIREMNEEALLDLKPVQKAFSEAEAQLQRYRQSLDGQREKTVPLRSYAVVAVGLERLLSQEI